MDLEAIRWALAERLAGMREACPDPKVIRAIGHGHDPFLPCPGYQPVPLTAEGLTDEGRLRRAIEAEGWQVEYIRYTSPGIHYLATNLATSQKWRQKWRVSRGSDESGEASDLTIAYLFAVGVVVS